MKKFSEYVSLGHPDKMADYISQYILDRYIERDPSTRYALEVQIKGTTVNLGGEVTSSVRFKREQLTGFVQKAVEEIGYTQEYKRFWGANNIVCGAELSVYPHIGHQSWDIAQGLDGWGDQGIFFGMATPDETYSGMPVDHSIAKNLCKALFESGMGGLDIKVQVVTESDMPEKIIVAIPLMPEKGTATTDEIVAFVRKSVQSKKDYEVIVNGTGKYIRHGSMADCGTTGRKLVVDFYGGNCKVGGGSPWTKDGSKADLSLNLVARKMAKEWAQELGTTVYTRLACCIGRQEVDFSVADSAGNIVSEGVIAVVPSEVISEYGLNMPIFASMCRWGLFGEFQQDKNWE